MLVNLQFEVSMLKTTDDPHIFIITRRFVGIMFRCCEAINVSTNSPKVTKSNRISRRHWRGQRKKRSGKNSADPLLTADRQDVSPDSRHRSWLEGGEACAQPKLAEPPVALVPVTATPGPAERPVVAAGTSGVQHGRPIRMVLDPKNNHNDYGSFESSGVSGSPHQTVDVSEAAHQSSDDTGLHSDSESSRLAPDMTQSDLYQRQPLLPPSEKSDPWEGSGQGSALHSPTSEYYRVDDKPDGLTIHRTGGLVSGSNGIVKIDVPAPLREEPRFPKEKWKTLVAFIILVVNFIITTASLALVHERVPERDKYPPLPDIFLDNVKAMDWALDVSEVLIIISSNTAIIVVFFHKHRFIVMRRIFMILALLYLMRSITMFVTVLPVASVTYYCSPKANSTNSLMVAKRVWQLISGFGLSINGQHTYCGDYIYSGHTVILTMSYLIIAEYSPKRCFPVHWISWVVSVTGVIMVLMAHGHYTVDVLIAYYVTTTLFWMYHTLANNANLKQYGPNNFLARVWWFQLFRYFEKNVGGPVPRQYEWPLPWPRWCHGKHPNRNS